jgi:hypothetical protein
MAGEPVGRRGRRCASGVAALLLLLPLAGCTGTDGGGARGGAAGPASSATPTVGADGKTSPGVVWSSGPRVRPRPAGAGEAVLTGVRTGRHEGFERVVFEFDGGLPGHRVAYVDEVTGPGPLDGEAFLLVTFDGARASDAGGSQTFAQPEPRPRYLTVKQVRLEDEGGGRARFAIGLDGVVGFKVYELPDPDRVIVDVAA